MIDRHDNRDSPDTQDREKEKQSPGPEPERLNLDGDWEKAVGKALQRGKPDRKLDRDRR